MDLTITVIVAWVFSVCMHEFGHAITAYMGGDTTVKDKGYLTLNPIVYFSSATTLVLPLLILLIGGIPFPGAAVAINTTKLRNRVWQSAVSAAGPFFTFLFIIGITIMFEMLPGMRDTIGDAHVYSIIKDTLSVLIYLQIFMLILNLLPIPPLDGWGIIEPWLPEAARRKSREIGNGGFAILFLLMMFVKPFPQAIAFVAQLVSILIGVDLNDAFHALDVIQSSSYPLMGVLLVAWFIRSKMAPVEEKADKLLKEKKYSEALELYDQSLAKKQDPRVMLASASALLSMGKKHEAMERANKAVELDPTSPQAQGIKSACLAELGDLTGAVEAADAAIKYDTNYLFVFPYFIKASALNELTRFDEALECINKYLQKEANSIEGLFVKANILENLEKYDEALAIYDKIARMKGGNVRGTLGKGMLLCALGRTEDGINELKKLMPADPAQKATELANLKSLLNDAAGKLASAGKTNMAAGLQKAVAELDRL